MITHRSCPAASKPRGEFKFINFKGKQIMLGIVCALPQEARCLFPQFSLLHLRTNNKPITLNNQTLLHICGIGPTQAEIATQELIAKGVKALLSFGTAAGLKTTLLPGDLLIPDQALMVTQDVKSTFYVDNIWKNFIYNQLKSYFTIQTGTLLHSTHI